MGSQVEIVVIFYHFCCLCWNCNGSSDLCELSSPFDRFTILLPLVCRFVSRDTVPPTDISCIVEYHRTHHPFPFGSSRLQEYCHSQLLPLGRLQRRSRPLHPNLCIRLPSIPVPSRPPPRRSRRPPTRSRPLHRRTSILVYGRFACSARDRLSSRLERRHGYDL